MSDELEKDEALCKLKHFLKQKGRAAVAFSGGTDSALLLKIAHNVLGEKCVAVTVTSDFMAESEAAAAKDFCKAEGISHFMLKVDVLGDECIAENSRKRCYFCKRKIFSAIKEFALKKEIFFVADGSNKDDAKDFRPGLKALSELGISSPLMEFGFTKEKIRCVAEKLNVSLWNKNSSACLASRFPYGQHLSRENLLKVEKAENFLHENGLSQLRVRSHGNIARIEVMPYEMEKIMFLRKKVCTEFKKIGYNYVTLDMEGFRSGSMNDV